MFVIYLITSEYAHTYERTFPFMFHVMIRIQRSDFLEKLQLLTASIVLIPSWDELLPTELNKVSLL